MKSIPGKKDRRTDQPQKVLWDRQQLSGLDFKCLHDQRIDKATVRALANMLHTVKHRRGKGMIFAMVNDDGTLDLGFTGKLFESSLLSTWAIDQLYRLLEHLPDHPEKREWSDDI